MDVHRLCLRGMALICGMVGLRASAQLSFQETKALTDTLFIGNLTPRDLEYSRRSFTDSYSIPFVNLSIDKPLEAISRLTELHEAAGKASPHEAIRLARVDVLGDIEHVADPLGRGTDVIPPEVPAELKGSVGALCEQVAEARALVALALKKLSPAEKGALKGSLPGWAAEGVGEIRFDFVRGNRMGQDAMLSTLSKVDLALMRRAAQRLAFGIDKVLPELRALAAKAQWMGTVKFNYRGEKVIISGVGDDLHAEEANLLIDLGGNDHYAGHVGAGLGDVSVLIDCGGDDSFNVSDGAVGCGLLGVGMTYKMGGHSNFHGKSLCFGAGLAGVGLLYREGGDDSYSSRVLTQGFGEFGIGLLIDTKGNDTYQAQAFAQGAGRTGGVGWLVDRAGDDTYIGSGRFVSGPNKPSFAQGFGAGYSQGGALVSGGVGLLTDLSGNDVYSGQDYCQSSSDWYSLASLYDGAGQDRYSANSFSQASALRHSAAYLIDIQGDDNYALKQGFGHAFSSDFGVAVLADRSGDDAYSSPVARPGVAQKYGLSLFMDSGGNDAYLCPSTEISELGALSLFIDDAGRDIFLGSDGVLRSGTNIGSALAFNGERQLTAVKGIEAVQITRTVADLMALAANKNPTIALDALAQLVQLHDPISFSTGQALLQSSELPIRQEAIKLVSLFPDALPLAKIFMADPDEHTARLGVQVLGEIGSLEALDLAGNGLSHVKSGIRIQALLALDGRVPAAYKQKVAELKKDPAPLVRAVASHVL